MMSNCPAAAILLVVLTVGQCIQLPPQSPTRLTLSPVPSWLTSASASPIKHLLISIPHLPHYLQKYTQDYRHRLDCVEIEAARGEKYGRIGAKEIVNGNVLRVGVEYIESVYWRRYELEVGVALRRECGIGRLDVMVMVETGEKETMLLPGHWVYMRKSHRFSVPYNETFLIDVVTCSGPLKLLLLSDPSQGSSSQPLQTTLAQSHAFKVTPNVITPTHMLVQAQQATLRYLPLNPSSQLGMGYSLYQWNYFLYQTNYLQLTVYLQPLRNTSQTRTQVTGKHYRVRVVRGVDVMEWSGRCGQLGAVTVYDRVYSFGEGEQPRVAIMKKQLLKKMPDRSLSQILFLTVDLSVELLTPENTTEMYRFLAPAQELPLEIFDITEISNQILVLGIVMIVAMIIGCLGLAYCFVMCVMPAVRRMASGGRLVEQTQQYGEMESLPVQSDRPAGTEAPIN